MRRRSPIGLGMLALVALLVAAVLAGCGSTDGAGGGNAASAGPDPASVTPASAAVYAEALVRPGGDVEQGVLMAARKVFQVDNPAAELHRFFDREIAGDGESYARDAAPWLGDRLAVFVLTRGGPDGDPAVGVVAAVRDRAALDKVMARQGQKSHDREGTYRGVDYSSGDNGSGTTGGVVGDFLVAGNTPEAFRAAVDAWKGSSLAESERYRTAVEPLDDDQLAFLYAEPRTMLDLLPSEAANDVDERLLGMARRLAQGDPVTLGLTVRADEIALELHADVGGTPLADLQDGELSVGGLPGDAWLALATPALGPLVRSILDAAGAHDDAARQVRGALGLDLDADLLDPLGGLAVFARGTSVLDLGGGAVLKMSDAGAARTLLTRLRAIAGAAGGVVRSASIEGFELQLPRVPQPIVVGGLGERVAAGYGRSSTDDLLNPQDHFDERPGGKAAIATLGEGFTPSLVVLVPPIAQLLESLDAIGIADMSKVLPYVRAYRSLAVGTQRDDDRVTVRVVAALR